MRRGHVVPRVLGCRFRNRGLDRCVVLRCRRFRIRCVGLCGLGFRLRLWLCLWLRLWACLWLRLWRWLGLRFGHLDRRRKDHLILTFHAARLSVRDQADNARRITRGQVEEGDKVA